MPVKREEDPSNDVEPPHSLKCPLTHDLYRDPVVISSGRTYDRDAIDEWLLHHSTDPDTGEELDDTILRIPNQDKRTQVVAWLDQNSHNIDGLPVPKPAVLPHQTTGSTEDDVHEHLNDDDTNTGLKCVFTRDYMRDPVILICADTFNGGHTYDRQSILRHLRTSGIDPVSNTRIQRYQLTTNWNIRKSIQHVLDENPNFIPMTWGDNKMTPAVIGKNLFECITLYKSLDVVKAFLGNHSDARAVDLINEPDPTAGIPIGIAIDLFQKENNTVYKQIFDLLIEKGGNVQALHNETSLVRLCVYPVRDDMKDLQQEMLRTLIERGASTEHGWEDPDRSPALRHAVWLGEFELADILYPTIDCPNVIGMALLECARGTITSKYKYINFCKKLVTKLMSKDWPYPTDGVEVRNGNAGRNTPGDEYRRYLCAIENSCKSGNVEIAEYLIKEYRDSGKCPHILDSHLGQAMVPDMPLANRYEIIDMLLNNVSDSKIFAIGMDGVRKSYLSKPPFETEARSEARSGEYGRSSVLFQCISETDANGGWNKLKIVRRLIDMYKDGDIPLPVDADYCFLALGKQCHDNDGYLKLATDLITPFAEFINLANLRTARLQMKHHQLDFREGRQTWFSSEHQRSMNSPTFDLNAYLEDGHTLLTKAVKELPTELVKILIDGIVGVGQAQYLGLRSLCGTSALDMCYTPTVAEYLLRASNLHTDETLLDDKHGTNSYMGLAINMRIFKTFNLRLKRFKNKREEDGDISVSPLSGSILLAITKPLGLFLVHAMIAAKLPDSIEMEILLKCALQKRKYVIGELLIEHGARLTLKDAVKFMDAEKSELQSPELLYKILKLAFDDPAADARHTYKLKTGTGRWQGNILHYLCRYPKCMAGLESKFVKLLISRHIDVNSMAQLETTDFKIRSALQLACESGCYPVVSALLEAGAKVMPKGCMKTTTPLYIAIKNGHMDISCALVDHITSMGSFNFKKACRTEEYAGEPSMLLAVSELLIDIRHDSQQSPRHLVLFKLLAKILDYYSRLTKFMANEEYWTDQFDMCMAAGCRLHGSAESTSFAFSCMIANFLTPLEFAGKVNWFKKRKCIFTKAIKRSIEVDDESMFDRLMYPDTDWVGFEGGDILTTCIRMCVNVETPRFRMMERVLGAMRESGQTIPGSAVHELLYASSLEFYDDIICGKGPYFKICALMRTEGFTMDVDAQMNGQTALYRCLACNYERKHHVKCLLKLGAKADILCRRKDGDTGLETPLHLSVRGLCFKSDSITIPKVLCSSGNVNIKNSNGNTPLHLAQNEKIAKLLLSKDADPFIRNADGKTPRQFWGNMCISKEEISPAVRKEFPKGQFTLTRRKNIISALAVIEDAEKGQRTDKKRKRDASD